MRPLRQEHITRSRRLPIPLVFAPPPLRQHVFTLPRVGLTPTSYLATLMTGVFALAQSAGVYFGGLTRFSGSGFKTLHQVPGGMHTWGVVLALAGALILIGFFRRLFRLKALGLFLVSIWATAFSYGAFVATFTIPTASSTGGPTYLLIAIWTATLAMVDQSRNDPTRQESANAT